MNSRENLDLFEERDCAQAAGLMYISPIYHLAFVHFRELDLALGDCSVLLFKLETERNALVSQSTIRRMFQTKTGTVETFVVPREQPFMILGEQKKALSTNDTALRILSGDKAGWIPLGNASRLSRIL